MDTRQSQTLVVLRTVVQKVTHGEPQYFSGAKISGKTGGTTLHFTLDFY